MCDGCYAQRLNDNPCGRWLDSVRPAVNQFMVQPSSSKAAFITACVIMLIILYR